MKKKQPTHICVYIYIYMNIMYLHILSDHIFQSLSKTLESKMHEAITIIIALQHAYETEELLHQLHVWGCRAV